MPVSLADWLGVAGLAIAILLAVLKIWETFFLRARIEMHFDWLVSNAEPSALRFIVSNSGRRRAVIREIRLGQADTSPEMGWTAMNAILNRMPLAVGPDDASAPFGLNVDPNDKQALSQLLGNGLIRKAFATLVNGKVLTFDVPEIPRVTGERATATGPVAKL